VLRTVLVDNDRPIHRDDALYQNCQGAIFEWDSLGRVVRYGMGQS
jgi:hypothetical protein